MDQENSLGRTQDDHQEKDGVFRLLTLTDPVTTSLELEVGPDADMTLATRIREFLANTYGPLIRDTRVEFIISLAAHELVENIIKYGTNGRKRLSVQLDGRKRELRIVTSNEATPTQIERVRAKLERICRSNTPEALYDELIAESADTDESGLGLIRLRAEADMHLAYEIEGNTVTICATLPLSTLSRNSSGAGLSQRKPASPSADDCPPSSPGAALSAST